MTTAAFLRVSPAARALALAAPVLLVACGGEPPPPAGPPAVPVNVGEVVQRPMPVTLEAIGTVESPATVSVRSRVGGEIVGVHFAEGQDVREGDLLVTLDPRPLEADLAAARARLARDRALARKAQEDVARYQDLVAKDYVTREQYDQAIAQAESLEATLGADEAAVRTAELELGYATIRAPLSGRTGSLLVHRGNVIKANDQPVVVIHQVAPIEVRFSVPQRYLPEIRRRASAGTLEVSAVTPEADMAPQTGKLVFVDNAVNADTGTIELKAAFPNPDRELWPGQFVEVSLRLATQDDAVVAPNPAVQTGQDGQFVFVVKDDLTVESRPVTVDRTVEDDAVIAEGLAPGERVVTDGQLRLVPGAKVEIKGEASSAAAQEATP